jgi:bacterial/archaeal transporter family protein
VSLSWVVLALASATVSGVVNIFDKTFMHKFARTAQTLPLLIGFAQTLIGVVTLTAVGIPVEATLSASLTAFVSGMIYGISGSMLMWVLFRQEVSRTIPVTQTAPIFAAVFALMFLGESVNLIQWIAIFATVSGAVLLSLKFEGGFSGVPLNRNFFILVAGAAIFAAGNIIGKIALDDLPVLYTHGLRSLGLGGVFLAVHLRREPLQHVIEFIKERNPGLLVVGTNELFIANSSLLLMLWALSTGPASLVTALVATRAMFVVIFSTLLALVWRGALGEVTTPTAIAVKVGSTLLIVAGVAGIATQ